MVPVGIGLASGVGLGVLSFPFHAARATLPGYDSGPGFDPSKAWVAERTAGMAAIGLGVGLAASTGSVGARLAQHGVEGLVTGALVSLGMEAGLIGAGVVGTLVSYPG